MVRSQIFPENYPEKSKYFFVIQFTIKTHASFDQSKNYIIEGIDLREADADLECEVIEDQIIRTEDDGFNKIIVKTTENLKSWISGHVNISIEPKH